MVERLTRYWVNGITAYPKGVLALICVLLVVAGMGLPRFKLDASSESLTLEHDRDLDYFREVSKNYDSGDFLVVTYTPQAPLFSDSALQTLAQMQSDLAAIDGVASVNSILNVPLLFSPKQSLREIADEPRVLSMPDVDRQMAKTEFLESPIYRDMILSPDGQTTALMLNIAVDKRYIELVQQRDALKAKQQSGELTSAEEDTLAEVSATFLNYRTQSEAKSHARVEAVREVVSHYRDHAEIFVGGITMITADMIAYIQKDLVVFGSGVVLFMILVLAVIFRAWQFVVIPMATCLSAVFLMLGLVSWLDWRLTVISSNFVALLLIISLAIIIHLIVRYREYALEFPNWTQRELVTATVQFMAKPCLYTTLTTVVAFVSLVVSDIRPVIDFGWMMTIGLLLALLLAFVLLPAGLMLLQRPSVPTGSKQSSGTPLTAYCAMAVEQRGSWVVVVSLLLAVLSVWGLTRLQVENRFVDYFHEDTEIHQGLTVIDQKLGGTTSLDIILNNQAVPKMVSTPPPGAGDEQDPFADMAMLEDEFEDEFAFEDELLAEDDPFSENSEATPYWMTVAGLEEVEKIHDYLRGLPEVGKVQSLAILYKVGEAINGGLNDFELAVMNKSLSPAVHEVLVRPYLNGPNETRITLRIHDTYPGLKRFELVENIQRELDTTFGLNMAHVRFSGLLVLYNNMLKSLFSSQIVTLGAVFLGILLMFLVLFRSFKVAVVAIVPNILAALCILGGMGLVGIPLDMMTITIAAITVGIGVDDTIHYIHRFKVEVAQDGNYIAAMHRAHRSIGRAMYYTSVIIIFGFSIMVLSEFIPTIYFGVLTGFAMLAALAGALFLLPKLIVWTKPFS